MLHRAYYARGWRNKATPLFRAVNNPLAVTWRTGRVGGELGAATIGKSAAETGKPMPHGVRSTREERKDDGKPLVLYSTMPSTNQPLHRSVQIERILLSFLFVFVHDHGAGIYEAPLLSVDLIEFGFVVLQRFSFARDLKEN